ncbi:N-formyl peptide receptor 2-like [Bufo gargarizans]|uniref:N-formyl peptide receptor 2-like n=1 Tax=Bufo gargarizans TaxID=30331 RepID=UPI001CF473FB|nr:N-formyl peptide receptor 2-like [Bufo gargarizans]
MNTNDLNLTFFYTTPGHRSYYEDYGYVSYSYTKAKLLKITVTLYSIFFVLGIIGNGLVIWIAGFKMKKSVSSVWFLNLAIADFFCCASLPLRIAEWIYLIMYDQDSAMNCILSIILFNLNMSASVLLLVAMSIDRFVSVMWPFWAKVHRTQKLVRITAAIIWVISLLLTGLVFYLYGLYFHDLSEWCALAFYYIFHNIYIIKWTIRLFRLVMMFAIPFLIIFISYVIIYIKVRKSKRSQRSRRPYRIITAVILCFFLCWFPYYIWPLIPMYNRRNLQFYTVNIIIINLACLNSCINPIIYVLIGQVFKPGFLRSIPTRLEKALSEHPNELCREREDCEPTQNLDV